MMLLVHHVGSLLQKCILELRYHAEEEYLVLCAAWPIHCSNCACLNTKLNSRFKSM